MDVASTLTHLKERSPEQWLRAANRFAPPAVAAALVLVIAYQLADLTWTVFPKETFNRPAPVVAQPVTAGDRRAASNADLSALTQSHLFGEAPEVDEAPAPVQNVVDAPDTTLSLRLTGLIADADGEGGQAIIASGRDEKQYAVGQTIDGASGATLHAVYGDRVILNRSGQLETLRLPKDPAESGMSASTGRSRPAPPPPPPSSSSSDTSLRDVISDNASQLTNIMRMAPQVEGGQMIGFRVNPGRDRETFEALGLQPGDVVTDINGMVLDDPSRSLQVFEALGESSMANVTVVRDGVPTVLVIDTSRLQNIAENRQ